MRLLCLLKVALLPIICLSLIAHALDDFSDSVEVSVLENEKLNPNQNGHKFSLNFYPNAISICQFFVGDILYKLKAPQKCPNNSTVAVGRYRNAQNESGWGILEVETFPGYPYEVQAYAAGLAEGYLTKEQIANHIRNTLADMCKNEAEYCRKLFAYLRANLKWIKAQLSSQSSTDIYWRHVNLTMLQMTGIRDAYNAALRIFHPNTQIEANDQVYLLQLSGEFYDLEEMFEKKTKSTKGHCSALVKVAKGNKDIWMSHNTMAGFNTMNRVVKLYKFGYDQKQVPGNAVSFSGYPGVLASQDDYTLTSAGLLSMETTINIFNVSLYKAFVKPEGQLHCWLRSYISNQLAGTAHDWVQLFAQHNSGTYNNQWMVLDYKLFKPGQPLPSSNLFWVLEQVPGTTVSRDLTWFLRSYGYWPSYNIPYLTKISELSGYSAKGQLNNWWQWGESPRAKIFERDHGKVEDWATLQALMRYNDYKHDAFSHCNCTPPYTATASIATRGDLNPANGTWELPEEMGFLNFASIDYKGTNFELFKQLRFQLIGGPTYGGPGNLPVFNWSTTKMNGSHFGQPAEWKFGPIETLWQTDGISANWDMD